MNKLPQAIELEEAIVGTIIADENNISEIMLLNHNHFYDTKTKQIFKVLLDMYNKREKIDALLVVEKLKELGKLEKLGGKTYVFSLLKKQTSSNKINKYAEIVLDKSLRRDGIKQLDRLISNFYDETLDIYGVLDDANKSIIKISSFASVDEPVGAKSAIKEFRDNLQEEDKPVEVTGVPSGFTYLDKVTGGWQPGQLIIDAGRPGMGKSASATDFARNAGQEGYKVAIFSLEMSAFEIWGRIISKGLGINSRVFTKRQYKKSLLPKIENEILKHENIYIDGSVNLSITTFVSKARRMKREYGIDLIIVDYLQLMKGDIGVDYKGNETKELNDISRGLKSVAMELKIPVISLAQLNRDVDKRKPPIPKLPDLKGSGAIEQDADLVLFHYRPEYYGVYTKIAPKADKTDCKGLGCIIIDKHRGGELAKIWLKFQKEYSSFSDFIYDLETGEEIRETLIEEKPF